MSHGVFHAQLSFVGQGRAGKTSTLRSLNGKPFNKGEVSTIGVASEELICELLQDSSVAWKPRTDDLNATERAMLQEMQQRSSGAKATVGPSMADVLVRSRQDRSSADLFQQQLAQHADKEDSQLVNELMAAPAKKSFFGTLRHKPGAERKSPCVLLTACVLVL